MNNIVMILIFVIILSIQNNQIYAQTPYMVSIPQSSTWLACSEQETNYISYSVKVTSDTTTTTSYDKIHPFPIISPKNYTQIDVDGVKLLVAEGGIQTVVAERTDINNYFDGLRFKMYTPLSCYHNHRTMATTILCSHSGSIENGGKDANGINLCLAVTNPNDNSVVAKIHVNFKRQIDSSKSAKIILQEISENERPSSSSPKNIKGLPNEGATTVSEKGDILDFSVCEDFSVTNELSSFRSMWASESSGSISSSGNGASGRSGNSNGGESSFGGSSRNSNLLSAACNHDGNAHIISKQQRLEEKSAINSNEHVNLDIAVDPSNLIESVKFTVLSIFCDWKEEELEFSRFNNGLTNLVVKCRNKVNRFEIIIRVYGKNSQIFVDRKQEIRNMLELSKLGLSAPLYAKFKNGLIYGFVSGESLTLENLKDPFISSQIAKKLATLHRAVYLEREIAKLNSPIVFCHNDLLHTNIVYQESEKKISFIDYECGSFNYRGFDIGLHFNNFAGFHFDYSLYPTKEFQFVWLRHYLDSLHPEIKITEKQVEELYREVSKFALVSLFYCSVWLISEITDTDLDFMEYAIKAMNMYYRRREVLAL
ncbi:9278_t:CDS:10 [Ambispora gerdemannii]|uniref:ethanolamine kinase n=1 Tax=Ambispora gerdemannii TaxID=144530 RepID=A0A9N9D2N5_9GLOM|nr:9278_t:CDS:10 [Ambispora gerdemannii]